jgi:hypothetical protein
MDNPRTDSARAHDDNAIIDEMEKAPSQGGTAGGNLQREIGSRAEEEHATRDEAGLTRVGAKDKPKQANMPRRNE